MLGTKDEHFLPQFMVSGGAWSFATPRSEIPSGMNSKAFNAVPIDGGQSDQKKLAPTGMEVTAKFPADIPTEIVGKRSQSFGGSRIAVGKTVLTTQKYSNGDQS